MAKLNFSKARERDRIISKGLETINGEIVFYGTFGGARSRSKKAARAELETALSEITRAINCACGHEASIALPASALGKQLRCRTCKATQVFRI